MKIHYLSCHSVLEHDEVSLFTEMGHEVFSNGAYLDPSGHISLPRPAIKGAKYYENYAAEARAFPKTSLPDSLIEPFDVFIIMHTPEVLAGNWKKLREKGKKVIWRSIGQSTPKIEKLVRFYKAEGLKIVRYSPKEELIPEYAGSDELIRFYKDPEIFNGWNGDKKEVINISQSLKGRRTFCHYDDILNLIDGFPSKVYGVGNDDLGSLNGGELAFDQMLQKLRDSRVFVYGGTWPASYTLSFMEAWMTGTPVVAIGQDRAENIPGVVGQKFYEVHNLIENGVDGFVSDNLSYLKDRVRDLLQDPELARQIGSKGREKAIKIFGKEIIKKQWEEFFRKIS